MALGPHGNVPSSMLHVRTLNGRMPNGHNYLYYSSKSIYSQPCSYVYVCTCVCMYVCMYGVCTYTAAPLFMHVPRTPAIHSNRQLNMTISMGGGGGLGHRHTQPRPQPSSCS